MNKLGSRELIRRMKPELSSLPIRSACINMNMSDVVVMTVEFTLTEELLGKLVKQSEVALNISGGQPSPPTPPVPPKARLISEDKRDQLSQPRE